MRDFSIKQYWSLLASTFFTAVQLYGLLSLNWSGLYVIYLYWVELVFLSLYIGIRYWQLINSESWANPEVYKCITTTPKEIKAEFAAYAMSRTYLLALYLLLIGVAITPIEKDSKSVETIAQFLKNLVVTDSLFILTAFSIVFYYLKLMFSKANYSKEDLVEFSFNIATTDPKILSPFCAVFALPFMILVYAIFDTSGTTHSNTYFLAMMLLVIRLVLDYYMAYIIRGQIRLRNL